MISSFFCLTLYCADYVAFITKTRLIEHYKHSLGAEHLHDHAMVLNTVNSRKLVEQYYKS